MRPLTCALLSLALVASVAAEEPKLPPKDQRTFATRDRSGKIEVRTAYLDSRDDKVVSIVFEGCDQLPMYELCPQARFLAVAMDMDILLFDAKTGKQVDTIPFPKPDSFLFNYEKGYFGAFSTKAKEAQLKLWKIPAPGEKIGPYKADPKASKKVILHDGKTIEVIDRFKDKNGKRATVSVAIDGNVMAHAITRDERFFAAAFKDRVIVYRAETGEVVETIPFSSAGLLFFLDETGALVSIDPKAAPENAIKELWRAPPK